MTDLTDKELIQAAGKAHIDGRVRGEHAILFGELAERLRRYTEPESEDRMQRLLNLIPVEHREWARGELTRYAIRKKAETEEALAEAEDELERRQALWTQLSFAIGRRSTKVIRDRYKGNTPEWINGETDELTVIFRDLEAAKARVAELEDEVQALHSAHDAAIASEREQWAQQSDRADAAEPCGWQPPETAPKEADSILAWMRPAECYDEDDAWTAGEAHFDGQLGLWLDSDDTIMELGAWMPLPPPPSVAEAPAGAESEETDRD